MKRILLCILLCSISLGNTKMRTFTEEVTNLNKTETARQSRILQRKEKIEKELERLHEDYNSRVSMTEKLKLDSEVNWYRDEYKEILKKYDSVQTDIEKEIEKREKELSVLNQGLGILEKTTLEY